MLCFVRLCNDDTDINKRRHPLYPFPPQQHVHTSLTVQSTPEQSERARGNCTFDRRVKKEAPRVACCQAR